MQRLSSLPFWTRHLSQAALPIFASLVAQPLYEREPPLIADQNAATRNRQGSWPRLPKKLLIFFSARFAKRKETTTMNPIQNISTQFSQSSSRAAREQTSTPANSSASESAPAKDALPENIPQPDCASASSNASKNPEGHRSDAILNETVRTALQARPGQNIARSPRSQSDLTLKMILNEVTGGMPAQPASIVKINGQSAAMSCVNANGVSYWGYHFLNSHRIVLTTGSPIWGQSGGLETLCVTEGQITIRYGAKLEPFEQLDLIAYSIKIEGEVQAKRIHLLSGPSQVNYAETDRWKSVACPQLIDHKDLANQGRLTLTQQAKVRAERQLWISSPGGLVNAGEIISNNDLELKATALEGPGIISATRDLLVSLENDYTHTAYKALQAGRHLSFETKGRFINQSILHSSGEMQIFAAEVDNQPDASIDSASTTIKADRFRNQGLISGGLVRAEAQFLNNEKGKIEALSETGELIVKADEIKNNSAQMINRGRGKTHISAARKIENIHSGVIFGRGQTQLTAQHIVNSSADIQDELSSVSKVSIGSVVASSDHLKLSAQKLENRRGTIYRGELTAIPVGTMADRGKVWVDEVRKRQVAQADERLARPFDKDSAELELHVANELDNDSGHIVHAGGGDTRIITGQFKNNTVPDERVESPGLVIGYGNLTVNAQSILNGQASQVLAGKNLNLAAPFSCAMISTSSQRAFKLPNDGDVPTLAQGDCVNQGIVASGKQMSISSTQIDNQSEALVTGAQMLLKAEDTLSNKGLIYGDTVAVGAKNLSNFETKYTVNGYKPSVIAANTRLDIGAKWLENKDHSLLFSGGNMTIGQQLDAQNKALGKALRTINSSATIDAVGQLSINTSRLINKTAYFKTRERVVDKQFILEVQPEGSSQRYRLDQLAWEVSRGGRQVVKDGSAAPFADYTEYGYMRIVKDTVVEESQPATIQAGGDMKLSGRVLNDKSKLISGGKILPLDNSFEMEDNRDAINLTTQIDVGLSRYTRSDWRGHLRGRERTYSDFIHYRTPSVIQQSKLDLTTQAEGRLVQHEKPELLIRHAHATSDTVMVRDASNQNSLIVPPLPTSGMHIVQTAPEQPFLVDIDPRFNHTDWSLSSNYLLNLIGVNPRSAPKRLGSGFYEQQLIRDQSIALAGQYALSYQTNQRAEYQALMRAGAEYAQQANLQLGMPLTAEQQTSLSQDIVWLVNQTIRLPNGGEQTVLVPQVYLSSARIHVPRLGGSGIAANEIDLTSRGMIKNAGTMVSTGKINLNAHNIDNRRGAIVSLDHLSLHASEDIDSRAGILAGKQITLAAEQDIHLQSQTQTTHALSGSLTTLDGLSRIQAEQLEVRAKADLNLAATHLEVSQAATLEAGHDLTLGTVATVEQQQLIWDEQNSLSQSRKAEVGTLMQTGGSLELKAGHDINAVGAYVHAGAALSVKAGRNIKVEAAYEERSFAESRYHEFNHLLSSSSESSQTQQYKKQVLNSTFSGGTVKMEAGHDLSATGSNIVGMHAVGLYAGNDIKLKAAKQIEQASYYSVQERSGLLDNGSLGYTIGEREQKEALESESTAYIGTIIGSVSGQIEAIAGREYQQSGSQLVAPEGSIRAKALKGTVDAVYEQGRRWQHSEWHQSGLTVSVSAPVIAAAQTGQQMLQASTQVSDPLMHMLAAGTIALGAKNAYDAIQADPKTAGGVTVSVMMGESHQEFQQTQRSTTALGSTITAGGTVHLEMEGSGEASTLNIIGSQIEAKQDVQLKVAGPLKIEAAPNTFIQHSEQHSQSSAAGLAATLGTHSSLGAAVAISSGRGHADGVEVSHTPAQIKAGRKLMLNAQSNVHLKGAQLSGQQVQASIEGDLEIESVQNASTYNSRYQSISGSATAGPASAVSINFSQQKINNHYLSVAEQAGIQAGEGGFQIGVKGDTKLAGGVIASTDRAIEAGNNQFITGTLEISDIENQARYNAKSLGLGIGYSKDGKGVGSSQRGQAITPAHKGNQLTNLKGTSAAMPIAMSASGQATSTTQSAISGAQIVIMDEQRQEALTGRSAEETIASLNRNPTHSHQALATIFNKTEIEAGFEIAGALGREANAFIANRAREADRKIEQAELQEALANENELMSIEQRQELYETATELRSQAQALNKQWGPGGTYRRVLTAVTAAASGNVAGTTAQFMQSTAMNYLQSLGAEKIKEISDNLNSEGVRAALHGTLAYGSAAVQGQEGGSAALGASASVLLSNLLGSVDGLSAQEKEARKNLVTGLVAGIAAASGADAALAQNAAQIEVENNQLALPPQALPPIGTPIAPLQPFRIPGRERHEGEEMPLFGGAPDRSRDRARPLVSPREAQQGVEPITTPMNEEVSEYGNAIFSEASKEEAAVVDIKQMLTNQEIKAIRSHEKRIAEHEQKLKWFKENMTTKPGMEGLAPDIVSKQQEARIRHLEKEIKTFSDNIDKIKGNGK